MKFATVAHEGRPRLCVVGVDGRLRFAEPDFSDLGAALREHGPDLPSVWRVSSYSGTPMEADSVTWLPPIINPGKVLCVALNNSANPARIISGPQHPALFSKPATSLLGHRQPIRLRTDFGRVHPEPELAVVIGTGGADISTEAAMGHVFGYTIFNDITSPSMRGEDTFHYRAIHPAQGDTRQAEYVDSWVSYPARYKGSDTFGPIGPAVVTVDEIPDPHNLRIRCIHQGRTVTDDNTSNLRFSVAEVIAFASSYLTLEVGDVIAMGTALAPAAGGQAVQNVDLTALGGPVEVVIDGLGSLVNPVVAR